MAAQAMATAMDERMGLRLTIKHNLLCENNKPKMKLLRSMFPNVQQAPASTCAPVLHAITIRTACNAQ